MHKDRLNRINIQETLDHPWLTDADTVMTQMRNDAKSEGDEMKKFISYANVDVNLAKEASKRSGSPIGMGPGSPMGS